MHKYQPKFTWENGNIHAHTNQAMLANRPPYAPPSLPRSQPPSLLNEKHNESTQANVGSGKNYRDKIWNDNHKNDLNRSPLMKQFETSKPQINDSWVKEPKADESSMAYTPFKQPSPANNRLKNKSVDELRQDYRPRCEESDAFEKDFVTAGSVEVRNSRPQAPPQNSNPKHYPVNESERSMEPPIYQDRGIPPGSRGPAVRSTPRDYGHSGRHYSDGVAQRGPQPQTQVWSTNAQPIAPPRQIYHHEQQPPPQIYASEQFMGQRPHDISPMENVRRASYAPVYGTGIYPADIHNERQVPVHMPIQEQRERYQHEAPPPYAGGFQKMLTGVDTVEKQDRPISKVMVGANGEVLVKHPIYGEEYDCHPQEKFAPPPHVRIIEQPLGKRENHAAPVFTIGLLKWPLLKRLSLVQLFLGIIIFSLGIARLAVMSVWGIGIEVVVGFIVALTGVLGLGGVIKRQYCCLVACYVMSAFNSVLTIPAMVSGLMVVVPYSFPDVTRAHFIGKDESPAVSILLAAVCITESMLAVIIAALGCNTAAKVLAMNDEERCANGDNEMHYAHEIDDEYVEDNYREQ